MRIEVTRSGGFAGLTTRASLDSGALSPAEADQIAELVERVPWGELAARPPGGSRGADRFQYEVRIDGGGRDHRVTIAEPQVPEELRTLIDRVLARGTG